MRITKEGNEIVVRIPYTQPSYDALDNHTHDTANLIGVIAGDECSISQLNDLGYKDDQQEGMPLIGFWGNPEGLRKVCKELDIHVWEHELCAKCKKPIYGISTCGKNGAECKEHEYENRPQS